MKVEKIEYRNRNRLKYFVFSLLVTMFGSLRAQTISGNIKIQAGKIDYTWIIVTNNKEKTTCDSLGQFTLRNTLNADTLKIIPFPLFTQLSIINFPSGYDSLRFDSIPLFRKPDYGYPIISFKTKRASRKYFKNREKEQHEDELELIQLVSEYVYCWNERNYKLKLVKSGVGHIVLLDLKQN